MRSWICDNTSYPRLELLKRRKQREGAKGERENNRETNAHVCEQTNIPERQLKSKKQEQRAKGSQGPSAHAGKPL